MLYPHLINSYSTQRMKISRLRFNHSNGLPFPNEFNQAQGYALTIGNFDGLHRGHQIMLAHLKEKAKQLGLKTAVLTFEPHPRDFFAKQNGKPDLAPARIATFRDKINELANLGIDHCIVVPFNTFFAQLSAQDFIQNVLIHHLNMKFLMVGDDFQFGAGRTGDFDLLQKNSMLHGFQLDKLDSFELANIRVSSSAVRQALAQGKMSWVEELLGRPYCVSGHIVHGRKLGRELGFRTINQRFPHWKPACSGIFAVLVHDLHQHPLIGVANMGVRPSLDPNDVNGGRVLLETHILDWPSHLDLNFGYGKIVRVELLHKLHDELRYDSLESLTKGIQRDCDDARAFFASRHNLIRRQTTHDRI